MPWGGKWWQRPSLGQLVGPQPGARPGDAPLGQAALVSPFSPTRPTEGPAPAGRLGAWFPDEAELRTWGGAELLTQPVDATAGVLVNNGRRLVQARFPVPLPCLLSVGATDPSLDGGPAWPAGQALWFRVTIGVAAGQVVTDLFKIGGPPADGVFFDSRTLAARAIQVDAFFLGPVPVASSARVWAGVAIFG